ncbi:MAG: phosphate/phosphite/phosphonate ABC transporter substrate-binding protein, partial [Chromatiales bacterium]
INQRFQPLADYLGTALNRQVVVRIGPNYAEHIDYIGMDKVDIAYMGPAMYVRMVDRFGKKPLLARLAINGEPVFHGFLVTREDSGISHIGALRGKRFAFGDPDSTMSYLVPRFMLLKAGIDVRDLADYQFLGSHVNVALAVLAGAFDAGAVKEEVFYTYMNRGLKALAKSGPYSEHLFVTRKDAPADFVDTVREALLHLADTEEGRKILNGIKPSATALVPVTDHDYDNLRTVLNTLHMQDVK